jgi:hypothetical protein
MNGVVIVNVERESADAAELGEQAFGVEKPRIRQAVRRKSLWCAHTERRWSQGRRRRNINLAIIINVIHEGTVYDFI